MRRPNLFGKGHHLFGDAHLEVHAGLQYILEQHDVTLLDVPAVFAQVHGDAIGACFLGIQGSLDRIRVTRAPGLAQGRHVVDVYAEKHAVALSHERLS
ncbi:hypothetical protein D3C75_826660 [compost metagenome]